MKPNRYHAVRFATLISFAIVFELLSFTGSHVFRSPDWTPLLFIAFAFASSLVGRALAYLTIFEWLRFPFTKVVKHSSGAGEDVHSLPADIKSPAWKIIRQVVGDWISCPICAGTWGALGLAVFYSFDPSMGKFLIYVLGGAGFAMLISRLAELIEWSCHAAHEMAGKLNRQNKDARLFLAIGREFGNDEFENTDGDFENVSVVIERQNYEF